MPGPSGRYPSDSYSGYKEYLRFCGSVQQRLPVEWEKNIIHHVTLDEETRSKLSNERAFVLLLERIGFDIVTYFDDKKPDVFFAGVLSRLYQGEHRQHCSNNNYVTILQSYALKKYVKRM
jgi:hypothetical protein